ncbi:endonuclease/exonuclease/phosphatase family protein [Proteinivorax tanatarense]|uniref:Endonuclease/exonuclease/phosphatase family protein n=1 Tax=Proteinivorax tanatarense TaxID=1260629 RepID=A0AAU7VHK4_9FIRM
MRIIVWNISCNTMKNDKNRAEEILGTINKADCDIVLLTEYQPNTFGKIIETKLYDRQYKIYTPKNASAKDTCSLLIAVKNKEKETKKLKYDFNLERRYVAIKVTDMFEINNLKILGIHVPPIQQQKGVLKEESITERKEPYIQSILKCAHLFKSNNEYAIIAGDFNPYTEDVFKQYTIKYPYRPLTDCITNLESKGWINCYPTSNQIGNNCSPNRLDYVFLSPAFRDKIVSFSAEFIETKDNVSDHRPLICEVKLC